MRPSGTKAGKWIAELHAHTPVADAARIALTDRLSPLPRLLARAAANLDSRHAPRRIHQLRVATRRAEAAIHSFSDVLGDKSARRMLRRLRRVRRAAGQIRELDVIIAALRVDLSASRGVEAAGVQRLIVHAVDARDQALPRLAREAKRPAAARLPAAQARLVESIDERDVAEHSAGAFARRVLRREADKLRAAAANDLTIVENVHDLRIVVKRIRYALELFAGCFDISHRRSLYPELIRLQDRLGIVNDAAVMSTCLASCAELAGEGQDDWRAGVARLAGRYAERLELEHRAFIDSWARDNGSTAASGFLDHLETALLSDCRDTQPPSVVIELKPTGRAASVSPDDRRDSALPALNGHAPTRHRIAAIDVGTNSLRLIVAEAASDGSYRVLDDEKEVTRLGRGLHATGKLDSDAIEHSVAAISRMKAIAGGYGASRIRVVATAAARAASNRNDLERAVADGAGLPLEIISAEQEAMLAYRSAARAFDLRSTVAAVADIGGGSTEVVLSIGRDRAGAAGYGLATAGLNRSATLEHQHEPANPAHSPDSGMVERIFTIPLGAVGLTERFGGPESCADERYHDMRRFVKRVIRQHIGRTPLSPQLFIGTGGTFTTLGAMALHRATGADAGGESGETLFSGVVQGFELPRSEVRHLVEYLRKLSLKDRARVPGLSADRADIIVAGLVIVDALLKQLEANRLRVHEGGIRDGLLLSMVRDEAAARRPQREPADPLASARRLALACAYEEPHSLHVARLALQIFDQVQPQFARATPGAGLEPARIRLILEAAAILHDIGYLINYAAHHKHSYHLIVHADLAGWSSREVQIIASVARYHRCAAPKRSHRAFAMLDQPDQQVVRALAAILRIADGLDRTHIQRVRSVATTVADGAALFQIAADEEPGVDLWGAARKDRLFQRVFGLAPTFDWRRAVPTPEPPSVVVGADIHAGLATK